MSRNAQCQFKPEGVKLLTEALISKSNIEFLDQPEGTNERTVILDPGQTYFVELRGKTVLWKVQPYISYNIENINHSPFLSCS